MTPRAFSVAALGFILAATVRAQLAPPSQDFVVNLGSASFQAPATADFNPSASYTMEGWFYLTGATPFGWLMGKGLPVAGGDPFIGFAVYLDNTGAKLSFNTATGAAGSSRGVASPDALPLRTWTHVAAVLDGTVMRLLINGAVVATSAAKGAPDPASTAPFGIGRAYQANGSFSFSAFPGFARQVRFWNVARTTAQISAALSESLPSDRTGLVAAWPLDEPSGTSARDLSGAARTLSSTGIIATRTAYLAAGPFYQAGPATPIPNVSLGLIINSTLMDFDGDGDDDLIVTDSAVATYPETRVRVRAFRNNAGTFVDATDEVLGNVTMVLARDAIVKDFTGDGRPDLLLAGHGTDINPFPGEQTRLCVGTADGRLVDESATRLPQKSYFTHSIAAADIDGDGDLDIYMGNLYVAPGGKGPRFYLNDGHGNFTEATDRIPADIANNSLGSTYVACLLADVNGDSRPDLLLGGIDGSPNTVLINDGVGHFARDSRYVLPPKLYGINGVSLALRMADFNGDGKPDLIISTSGGTMVQNGGVINGYGIPGLQLLLNQGDGTFTDATAGAGFTWSDTERWVVSMRIVDLDGDGLPDILAEVATATGVGASQVIPRIFLSRGNGQFIDASGAYLVGAATGFVHASDFDRDGRVDLVTVSHIETPSNVVVARNVNPLDRTLFATGQLLPSRLANLSVLTNVTAGIPQFTVGTVIGGPNTTGVKPLLIRAGGPSLIPLNVAGALSDPKLDVFSGSTVVATNDNWGGTPALTALFNQVGAFAYTSGASLDSAVAYSANATAGAASLTVQVSGVGAAVGTVIAELYDAAPSASFSATTPRLVNVSVLKQIDSGGILTAGFVIQGLLPKQVLIRAVGPTLALAPFGIGSAMSDPKLDLFLGQTVIASNDNWGGSATLSSAFSSVGAFALGPTSKDAALLVTLFPGSYTAQASGVAGTSGLAIVEVYEVP